jgi:hypothetical protein
MKKFATSALVILLFSLVVGCHRRALPEITSRETDKPRVGTRGLDLVGDKVNGQTVFTARCGRCHALPDPVKYSERRWESIISSMAPRARLSAQEEADVRVYVKERAGK